MIFSSGRWDWGYLKNIAKELNETVLLPRSHHNYNEIVTNHKIISIYPIYSTSDIPMAFNDTSQIYSDYLIVLGDRFETLAVVYSFYLKGIPIFHIHGGEVTEGSFDNGIRNAITQLSSYHFVALPEYAENVHRMTDSGNIWITGSPALDNLPLKKPTENFIVACFHPVTKELDQTEYQIKNFIKALKTYGMKTILIMPNIDPKNDAIRKVVMEYLCCDRFVIAENINRKTYLDLLSRAKLMAGNSSSGIIEAASFNLPVVNVGTRQKGRLHADNVIHSSYDWQDILKKIQIASSMKPNVINPYGDGHASEKICEIIRGLI